MQSAATTVKEYLAELPEDRRAAIASVRRVILKHLPKGYEEAMGYGMIAYVVPHRLWPAGYHCDPKQPLMYAALASQKNHMALYLMSVYGDRDTETWFRAAYKASGKKLDMGKSCVRFKRLDDLPLDVIGELVARIPVRVYLDRHEKVLGQAKSRKKPAGKNPARNKGSKKS